jgi:hypothetical protein
MSAKTISNSLIMPIMLCKSANGENSTTKLIKFKLIIMEALKDSFRDRPPLRFMKMLYLTFNDIPQLMS